MGGDNDLIATNDKAQYRRGVSKYTFCQGQQQQQQPESAETNDRAAKCQQGDSILLLQLSITLCGFVLCRMWTVVGTKEAIVINQDDDDREDDNSFGSAEVVQLICVICTSSPTSSSNEIESFRLVSLLSAAHGWR